MEDFQATKASVQAVLERSVRSARNDPALMAELREIVRRALEIEPDPSPGATASARTADEPRQTPWVHDLRQLKHAAGLTDEELGQLFGVSRASVQGWLNRGQRMRPDRQQHLRALVSVVEGASRSMGGDAQKLRYALLNKVGLRNKSPLDYLREQEYRMARGFLNAAASPKRFDPSRRRFLVDYPVAPSLEEREAALEALSPTPRVD